MLYAKGPFHGLTCGALSLMGNGFWRDKFGPMLPDTDAVPFNDLAALKTHLSQNRYAAFFVEPLQSEAGIRIPAPDNLSRAQELCHRYGNLLVFDEVQTGLFRTDPFLAAHHFAGSADTVVLAKALSGGLIPVRATLMTDRFYDSVYDSLKRSIIQTSTRSENSLAMRTGPRPTLDVLERERLGQRALDSGEYLRSQLTRALSHFPLTRNVRGLGMLSDVEFQPPQKLAVGTLFEAFRAVYAGMFGQVIVMRLFRD